jgi:hypothetical protein
VTDDTRRDDPPGNIVRAFRSFQPAAVFDVIEDGTSLRRIRVFACFDYAGLPQ